MQAESKSQAEHKSKVDVSGVLSAERSGFRTLTVMLPPDLYEQLIQESARRRIAGEPNRELSSMLREAVNDYFSRNT
jgi:hypothetical protein